MEEESFLHMCHEHPLSLIPDSAKRDQIGWCYGCRRYFIPEDATYGCRSCGFIWLLHKECMEMPREIMHPIHPSHPLTLHYSYFIPESLKCAVCNVWGVYGLHYRCSEGCEGLSMHLACAGTRNEKHPPMEHPSHPEHPLRFSKKTRRCPFPCDACGATEKGDSYTCTLCDYSIHESCALLPESKDIPHHHHSLSLAFYPPPEYIRYNFYCAICNTTLQLRRWIYHCHLCSYVVHLNCAINTSSTFDDENENAIDDEKEVTKFPIAVDDMYEKMIRPFVKRQSGQIFIPHDDHGKHRFFGHPDHLLTYTTFSSTSTSSSSSSSSSSSHYHYEIDNKEEDDFENIPRSELMCDGCTLAIHEKKQTDDEYENGYMSCGECKYFLHLSCFNLPLEIPSLPIHPLKDHNLRLQNVDGNLTGWISCHICHGYTNGLYYACTYSYCDFRIDIKCASLPNTIKHAAHPRHNHLKLVAGDDTGFAGLCAGCSEQITRRGRVGKYRCSSCRFSVCGKCVMLPARNKHRAEKHLLSLTYDAYANRPGDFYCSSCEERMHPRIWMYHCRDCDQSFHPGCFPATSGDYRNINFGTQQYVIPRIHGHSLRFQIITKKKRCDLCHDDSSDVSEFFDWDTYYYKQGLYDGAGFQCESCFFVACKPCGVKHIEDAHAI